MVVMLLLTAGVLMPMIESMYKEKIVVVYEN